MKSFFNLRFNEKEVFLISFFVATKYWGKIFADIGGMLVHTVLKSNQIAQHVIQDGKAKTNGGKQKTAIEWFELTQESLN